MMQLDPRASAAGVRLIAHDAVGSTNAEALTLARHGERGPLWVTAARQSAGKGRRGRAWVSEPGNLYASLLITDPASPEHWPELSFVAALAIHDALVEISGTLKPKLTIKWPNDVLLAGEKVAGILLEAEGEAVVIGIGVNCTKHPTEVDFPATDLTAAGVLAAPETLFGVLSAKMLGRLAQWNGGEGFSTVRADWLARAAGIGEDIRVRLSGRELAGVFEALDDAGGLMLRLPDGKIETITAGDVFMTPEGGR